MPIPSNRSSSPNPSRTNPDSTTPESRKSFNGNAFTRPSIVPNPRNHNPVSPSKDLTRRNSGFKEGIASLRVSYEQKENVKDQDLKLMKSRAHSVSKGTKNFMSPTISAASKIAASPRKKVLVDRNEIVRTSISDYDGKSSFTTPVKETEFAEESGSKSAVDVDSRVPSKILNLSSKPKTALSDEEATEYMAPQFCEISKIVANQQPFSAEEEIGSKLDIVLNSHVPSDAQNFSLTEPRIGDSKCNNEDLGSKVVNLSCSPFTVLAPLDSDPYLPPYDPKTNYLSPRPQFLHYKPKPRIEVDLSKESGFDSGEGKRLEDSFTSESCSDTENSEETQSSVSQKESDDTCVSEIMSEDDTHASELEPDINTLKQKRIVQVKELSNSCSCSFARSKIVPILLVLVIACLFFPVTDSPVLSPSVFKDQTFKLDVSFKIAELAKANLNELASVFRFLSVKSTSYLSRMISIPRVLEDPGHFSFVNLTALDEELLADGFGLVEFGDKEMGEIQGQNSLESMNDREIEEVLVEEQNRLEIQMEEKVNQVVREEFINTEFEEPSPPIPLVPEVKPEILEALSENFDSHMSTERDILESLEFQDQKHLDSPTCIEPTNVVSVSPQSSHSDTPPHFNIPPQISEFEVPPLVSPQSSDLETTPRYDVSPQSSNLDTPHFDVPPQSSDSDAIYESSRNFETLDSKYPEQNVLGISSLLLMVIAAIVYHYLKPGKASTPELTVSVQQLPLEKLISESVSASSDGEYLYHNRLSQNWQMEVDTVGGSGPSEVSSSFKKSLSCCGRGSERTNDIQSYERILRNSKRESLTSPSEFSAGSPSYGSFTTYEKIHGKHGCGDEEVVTPVRRSSRIRKQITSP